ncbi:CAP domain-containing protein [Rubripirellula reticaptiva]|uniref:Cysteine-rich secretory protein family protein n=1 Tax=Rubripirellula reticaptiva TaxID=2528013 RepID=A0A5C6EVK9_9BACT|nr:CAP domain-containing protein [Rubripirellula reticaptiva]TWU51261.1 Cysteine-rich secretory protein family protein [Rubripirellula reticaptiva]
MRQLLTLMFLLAMIGFANGQNKTSDDPLITEVETAIVLQTNEFRKEDGLPSVNENANLTETASKFASFMATREKYGHHADGRTPAQRAKASGYKYCVVRENIAYRTNTGEVTAASLIEAFVQGWIDSPPHRENMLADYVTQTGVAVASADGVTYYAVQLFERPKSAAIQLKVTNESDEARTMLITANDSEDSVELPPRAVITMKRCFPTTLKLENSDSEVRLTESSELTITEKGLTR